MNPLKEDEKYIPEIQNNDYFIHPNTETATTAQNETQTNISIDNQNVKIPARPIIQHVPLQKYTFKKASASIPETMKPFEGFDYTSTPEESLQQ